LSKNRKLNKLLIQILSLRPFKTMGYGLGRSPFFVVGNSMGNK